MLPKIKYQQLNYTVTAANQQITIDAETDKLYKTCTGINVLITLDTAKFSTIHLDMNNIELFPEKFEVVRILFRAFAPFGYEYQRLNEPAAGSRIKGTYTDSGVSLYPYNVTISLRLENTEFTDAGKID
jgi:hypothetical protein